MGISRYGRAVALLAGVSMFAIASSAHAGTVSISDSYYGGLNTYNNNGVPIPNGGADIIGNADFQIYGVDITRNNSNGLEVKVYTNFVNHVGEDGVGLGALFLRNGNVNFNQAAGPTPVTTVGAPTWSSDQASADPSRFQYAVQIPTLNPGASGSGTVWQLAGNGSDVVYSNVSGNPITYPLPGSPNFYFREGQAVGVNAGGSTTNVASASYSIGSGNWGVNPTGTLTFDIASAFGIGGFLQDTFSLAWAMTCGNDVIYAATTLNAQRPTPLPAALPMMAGGLGIIGLVARKRRKKNAALAQA